MPERDLRCGGRRRGSGGSGGRVPRGGVRRARGDAGRQSARGRTDLARGVGECRSGVGWLRAHKQRGVDLGRARVRRAGARACWPSRRSMAIWRFGTAALILATGARERFLPFPGWTLPNVMGAGGLQALAKSGLPVAGKRMVVAGSGPLLLAVANYMRDHGAEVRLIAEQADAGRAAALRACGWRRIRASWCRRSRLRARLLGVPLSDRLLAGGGARAADQLAVRDAAARHGSTWSEPLRLPGVRLRAGSESGTGGVAGLPGGATGAAVDDYQQTSVPGRLLRGRSHGHRRAGSGAGRGRDRGLCGCGNREARAQGSGARAIAPAVSPMHWSRPSRCGRNCARWPQDDTLVCRCEDVPLGRVQRLLGLARGQTAHAVRHGSVPGTRLRRRGGVSAGMEAGIGAAAGVSGAHRKPETGLMPMIGWLA